MTDDSRGDSRQRIASAVTQGKPSKAFTKEQLIELAEIKHKNKMDSMSDLVIKKDDQYNKLTAIWADAQEEDRKSIIFGLVINNGASTRDIARLFAIKTEELKQYAVVMNQATAALKLKVQGNQLSVAFMSDVPQLKFFLGKQFAEQVENPAHEGKESLDESKEHQININVVGGAGTTEAVVTGSDSVLSQTHLIQ